MRRTQLGLILAIALAFATVPAAPASAAVVMEAFTGGPTTNNKTPTFSGSTEDHFDPVTVNIYEGETATGTPVQTPTGFPSASSGIWSVTATTPLLDGKYTAVAQQLELGVGGLNLSSPYNFTVETLPPTVTLNQPPSPSNNTVPTFSGTASAEAQVVVHIYEGTKAEGTAVSTATATGTGAAWSSTSVSPQLASGEHTYTAVATQVSPVGNPEGVSNPVTFAVDTLSPTVMLGQLSSLSNNRTPSFSGTASAEAPVVVHIYEGTKAEGTAVSSATASGTGAFWSSGNASPALALGEHTYTAQATQVSPLGNPDGVSNPVTFTVDTLPPTVTLSQPPSPSNNRSPSFSGTASAETQVVVHVYEGTKAEGTAVSTATATGTGAAWSSTNVSPQLANGEHTYTAVATQVSPLGNPDGVSSPVTFTVDTRPPTVTLNQPPSPSNNRTPSFSGTASAEIQVVVHIHEGTTLAGKEVSSATATGVGRGWSSTNASPQLANGEHTYTAVATQVSPLGNPEGVSNPVTFTVDTLPPTVTLNQPPSPSNNTVPTFSGTASAEAQVVVHIYEGTKAEGTAVSTATATGTGAAWSSTNVSPQLASGEHTYTAVATQESPLGNPEGVSSPVTFAVDTLPPKVTLTQASSPSNNRTPSFSGTASAETQVVVHIYEGTKAEGTAVSSAKASGTGRSWSSGNASPQLASGEHTYTAVATQESPLGNPDGVSNPVTFTVDTLPPTVTLSQPLSPSNNKTPSFAGSASAETQVVVHIHEGTTPAGKEVASATATGVGHGWSSGNASPQLANGEHTYTAVATQVSPLGNPQGVSNPATFTVDTLPPTVTLSAPPTPSRDTTPSFSGTASAETQVVVHIYEGTRPEGTPVSSATASGTGASWSSTNASPQLASGEQTYTAQATQVSPLGNPEGKSSPVSFVVTTEAPKVTLNSPALRSNNTTPSFSGRASDATPVTVQLYEGASTAGTLLATLKARATAGSWTSANVSAPLANGQYTAVATQPSSLGNPTGVSNTVTFEVDTASPTVTLRAPPSPSRNTTPSFSGTASEATQVTVEIFEGTRPEGKIVATATAQEPRGSWTSGPVTPGPLPSGRHAFTAVAIQASEIKNAAGESAPVTFVIDTEPPKVTLKALPSPSNNTRPSFSGTASEATQVTVEIFEGPKAEGKVVATATATPTGASWTSGQVTPALASGTYTALATQPSAVENPPGKSASVTFTVDTSPPRVTLNALPSPSGNAAPSFSGTASDHTAVTVEIHKGAAAEGAVVASTTAEANGGEWASPKVSQSLEWGEYTAVATQPSSIGNPSGVSPPVTFAVEPIAPAVATEAATVLTRTSAALYAWVNPAGGTVSGCYFEYGTTQSYGENIDCGFVSEASGFPPSGTAVVPVFARIYGLSPGTTYHFRIVAAGEGGIGSGADQTFTTLPPWIFNEEGSSGGRSPAPSGSGGARGTAAAGVAGMIAAQLAPFARTARIGALLRSGVFTALFKAPAAGAAVMDWYYSPPAAKHARKTAASPVLLAAGGLTFHAAGTAALKLHLTGAGRRLLSGSRRIRLTATCVFTPVGARSVRTSAPFELRR